ncbi:MAG: hypothetical protein K1X68_09415 [Saprospiraceae bacterium]|nr:hypothetical protein [Saprospiraceae bacterium]HMW38040.1 hypothetical protein [Saprospiraceae bacterium]HMX87002.1 hypothetical protein [Saprospiraceae bacterium]HMZ39819.1 hypothetical protein [Saprospiraceae bacterium]HNA65765.1 hypothetical protein [Saprospiraceae bacterium]
MATHKSTHICKPHKPMHKAKLAKECAFQLPNKNYFPSLLFIIFFCHALTAGPTKQDNFLTDNNSTTLTEDRRAADNSSLAKWRVPCFYNSLVLNQIAFLRLNFCAKNPTLRLAANRSTELAHFIGSLRSK